MTGISGCMFATTLGMENGHVFVVLRGSDQKIFLFSSFVRLVSPEIRNNLDLRDLDNIDENTIVEVLTTLHPEVCGFANFRFRGFNN